MYNVSSKRKQIYTVNLHIPAKPLHSSDTVSVHFNHFYCMEICGKLRRDLAMLTYIYLDVDESWLTSSVPQKRIKFQISLHYANIEQNAFSWCVVDRHVSFKMVEVHITLLLPYSVNNDRHRYAWLNKDYSSPGILQRDW